MTLRERVYDELRRRIITRELAPGAVLSEHELAAALGVSRTPVREALARLRDRGLVKYAPNKGMSVAELTLRDFMELSTLLRALQQFAVSELIRADIPYETREIRRLHERQGRLGDDYWRAFDLNIEMHTSIMALLGNRRMVTVAEQLWEIVMLAGYVSSHQDFRRALAEVMEEHEQIIEALDARSFERFSAALRYHDERALARMAT